MAFLLPVAVLLVPAGGYRKQEKIDRKNYVEKPFQRPKGMYFFVSEPGGAHLQFRTLGKFGRAAMLCQQAERGVAFFTLFLYITIMALA
jgi:hypothetical protein